MNTRENGSTLYMLLAILLCTSSVACMFGSDPDPDPDPAPDQGQDMRVEPDMSEDMPEVEPDMEPDQDPPVTSLSAPMALAFGEVFVGASADLDYLVTNDGNTPVVLSSVGATGDGFTVLPPGSVTLAPGATASLAVRFAPASAGDAVGSLSGQSASGELFSIELSGRGVAPSGMPELTLNTRDLDLGATRVGASTLSAVLAENTGGGVLVLDALTSSDASITALATLPVALAPGESRALPVRFAPTVAGRVRADLEIFSGGELLDTVRMKGVALDALALELAAPRDVYVKAGADNARDQITQASTAATTITVELDAQAMLTGQRVELEILGDVTLVAVEEITDASAIDFTVDTSSLAPGPVRLSARVVSADGAMVSEAFDALVAKLPATLQPPIVDPTPVLTDQPVLTLTGTAPAGVRVFATPVGCLDITCPQAPDDVLGASEMMFSIDVDLLRNQTNVLLVCAEAGGEVACARPFRVSHLNPSEFIIASSSTRRLTEADVDQLVQNGVIDLDDPDNFHVSEFAVCLGVNTDVCSLDYVAIPNDFTPGVYTSRPGMAPVGATPGRPVTPFVLVPPRGLPPIPGVLVILGKIFTLKEMFQVRFQLLNTSTAYSLEDVTTTLSFPDGGLTALASAAGDVIADIQPNPNPEVFELDTIDPRIGDLPGSGQVQYVVRGDAPGVLPVRIDFEGTITGPDLPMSVDFAGAVDDAVEVYGKPDLDVKVITPPSVVDGVPFDLTYEITNLSPIPVFYVSLDLVYGEQLYAAAGACGLIEPTPIECCALPTPGGTFDLGTLEPGETGVVRTQGVSCVSGPITSCSFAASENIRMTVRTGTGCEGLTTSSVPRVDPPAVEPLSVVETSLPASGIFFTNDGSALTITLSEEADGVLPDTLTRITRDGMGEITSATLFASGNVFLERTARLGGRTLARVPSTVTPTLDAQGRTVLDIEPGSEGFGADLTDGATYRVTILEGPSGPMTAGSMQSLRNEYTLEFKVASIDTSRADVAAKLLLEAQCAYIDRCQGFMDIARNVSLYREFEAGLCDERADGYLKLEEFLSVGIGAGDIALNATALDDALFELRTASCAPNVVPLVDLITGTVLSRDVFVGLRTENQSCRGDIECASGLECITQESLSCAPSVCTPPRALGGACREDSDCGPDGRCQGSVGSCVAYVEDGQACTFDSECRPGKSCNDGSCGDRLANGEACSSPNDCASGNCFDRTCAAPSGQLGDACGFNDLCTSGLRCGLSTFKCVPARRVGERCLTSESCPVGAACSSGACRALPNVGEPCDETLGCRRGACIQGTCTLRATGDSCVFRGAAEGECASGRCVSQVCVEQTPTVQCDHSDHCAAGEMCLVGICSPVACVLD